jgi:hypothetical protein
LLVVKHELSAAESIAERLGLTHLAGFIQTHREAYNVLGKGHPTNYALTAILTPFTANGIVNFRQH